MRPWRCTSQTEYYDNLDSDNQSPFWSYYIQMWDDRYDYIPTREPIIVPELVYVLEYMPWFRIHGKSYLLSAEERQRQLRLSTRPRQSPGPSSAPIQSLGLETAPT
ncbi:hypothetical protein Gotur_004962 [Gossypium turneri]